MKRIFKNKFYQVDKYTETSRSNYGILSGEDVHSIIKGTTYDADFDMWFTKSASVGYSVEEVR